MSTRYLRMAHLEVTNNCQLGCKHCYAGSGPTGTHGNMQKRDWERVIKEVAELGGSGVQFIGGEPTRYPYLADLICLSRQRGLEVEVFSNLAAVKKGLWPVLEDEGVRLATSYYSDDPIQHDRITSREGSHRYTRDNIAKAVQRDIPIRVGITVQSDDQRWQQGIEDLVSLGVQRDRIGCDSVRGVGRGLDPANTEQPTLCGQCTAGRIAVSPDGTVWPCVFARTLEIGNVLRDCLFTVLSSETFAETISTLNAEFALAGKLSPKCPPDICGPDHSCRPVWGCNPPAFS